MTESLVTPASSSFEKLKAKLRELFELDKADLDFGIYRILRQRHAEITEFLDKHLETTVRAALQSHGGVQLSQMEEDLRKAEEGARSLGVDPEQSPRVKELRAILAGGGNLDATADEVYSHLLTFFSRYYQEGDFLGLHRSTVHGRERYMIPYNGEEVKLVWANMDQYYIKSSELLRDYTFRVRQEGLFSGAEAEAVIHFKLVEGDTEKDNRKPDGKTTRAYALDAGQPFEEIDANKLNIRFRYREHTAERDLQKKLSTDTEKTLADNLPPSWKALLFADDPTYKGKDNRDTRTILQKHLRGYTARHQFDYFIHKDLGGFLRRELDFYVKNEVMYLDDIEEMSAPKAEEYLSKIRALRHCALPVIQMLEQLENFQKRLWLKKKFVVETRYCLTLDRVPESLHQEICANDAQWAEWEQLYAISEIAPDLFNSQSAQRTPEFLKTHPHLMIDTRHFSRAFTQKLLTSIENLDEILDGVSFHCENFQALQLMQERYREQVKCVYIDPPYNTDASPIMYKNGFKDSTFASLILDRVQVGRKMLEREGALCAAIDDVEVTKLREVLEIVFDEGNQQGIAPVRSNPAGRSTPTGFSIAHDYAIFFSNSPDSEVGRLKRTERQLNRYDEEDSNGRFEWVNFRKHGGAEARRAARPKMYYPFYIEGDQLRIPELRWAEDEQKWIILEDPRPNEIVTWPINERGQELRWKWGIERTREFLHDFKVGNEQSRRIGVYCKSRMDSDGALPLTWWDKKEYSATEYGTNLLKDMFGDVGTFSFPKAIHLVEDCLRVLALDEGIALDFFGGSGTTGHAVINLNREDGGNRKYILAEMGEYFDTVLVPRLKKVVYATNWREGKPQSRTTGISHAFKILRLESYEDTLNNLRLARTLEQEAALQTASEEQRGQYLLGYFLDVESAGSASLLDVTQFHDPFAYKLHIATTSAGETRETAIDLVETFNWLIGLKVKHIDAQKGFVTVKGEKRAGGRTLIVWRTLGDDPKADNEALEKYLAKVEINPADTEYDFIYVNGSHTLNDPHNKIHLIEEEFQRRMFESEGFETLV